MEATFIPTINEKQPELTTGLENAFSNSFTLDFQSPSTGTADKQQSTVNIDEDYILPEEFTSGRISVSPATPNTLPALSPATYNWLNKTLLGSTGLTPDLQFVSSVTPSSIPSPNSLSGLDIDPISGNVSASPNATVAASTPVGMIDWKALNDAQMHSSKDPKWKIIPQHDGAPTATTRKVNTGGIRNRNHGLKIQQAAGTRPVPADTSPDAPIKHPSADNKIKSVQLNGIYLWPTSGSRHDIASDNHPDCILQNDFMNKRKAIMSPEVAQYSPQLNKPTMVNARRPSKKTQIGTSVESSNPDTRTISAPKKVPDTRCKCSGHCRNARCACVKAGQVCGKDCRCTSCRNPFLPIQECGIEPLLLREDQCFMHNLSKIKDMGQRLNEMIVAECCGISIPVKVTIAHGYECEKCKTKYVYSFCWNRLCNVAKKPRNHCHICKRCGDHRNRHCYKCGHCYFAGVASSFVCTCSTPKESENPNTAKPQERQNIQENVSRKSTTDNKALDAEQKPKYEKPNEKDDGKADSCPVQ